MDGRFAHQNVEQVKKILKKNNISWQEYMPTVCASCCYGKHKILPVVCSSNRATKCAESICADRGHVEEKSIGGSGYFLLLKDDKI